MSLSLRKALGHLRRQADGWLLAGAALALAACLFEPTFEREQPLTEQVVVLDITQSMNVQDVRLDGKPASRLDVAKAALRGALLKLPCGSKLGWAVFTEYRSFLLLAPVEVCANLGELRATLARIDNRMAWVGNSEVAKGLHSGLQLARQLPGKPALVFVTDGHEAPPINPRFRPSFDDKPGDVAGLVVGVGGDLPVPIPKSDPLGRPLGFWRADEVLQTDPRTLGRGGSVGREQLVDDAPAPGAQRAMPGATPGSEHLSSLREGYLRLLSGELGLQFLRLENSESLSRALMQPQLSKPAVVPADARPWLGGLAGVLLLLRLRLWRARPSAGARARAT